MDHRTTNQHLPRSVAKKDGGPEATCPWTLKAVPLTNYRNNAGSNNKQQTSFKTPQASRLSRRFSLSHEMSNNANQIYANTHNLRLRESSSVIKEIPLVKSPSTPPFSSTPSSRPRARSIAYDLNSPPLLLRPSPLTPIKTGSTVKNSSTPQASRPRRQSVSTVMLSSNNSNSGFASSLSNSQQPNYRRQRSPSLVATTNTSLLYKNSPTGNIFSRTAEFISEMARGRAKGRPPSIPPLQQLNQTPANKDKENKKQNNNKWKVITPGGRRRASSAAVFYLPSQQNSPKDRISATNLQAGAKPATSDTRCHPNVKSGLENRSNSATVTGQSSTSSPLQQQRSCLHHLPTAQEEPHFKTHELTEATSTNGQSLSDWPLQHDCLTGQQEQQKTSTKTKQTRFRRKQQATSTAAVKGAATSVRQLQNTNNSKETEGKEEEVEDAENCCCSNEEASSTLKDNQHPKLQKQQKISCGNGDYDGDSDNKQLNNLQRTKNTQNQQLYHYQNQELSRNPNQLPQQVEQNTQIALSSRSRSVSNLSYLNSKRTNVAALSSSHNLIDNHHYQQLQSSSSSSSALVRDKADQLKLNLSGGNSSFLHKPHHRWCHPHPQQQLYQPQVDDFCCTVTPSPLDLQMWSSPAAPVAAADEVKSVGGEESCNILTCTNSATSNGHSQLSPLSSPPAETSLKQQQQSKAKSSLDVTSWLDRFRNLPQQLGAATLSTFDLSSLTTTNKSADSSDLTGSPKVISSNGSNTNLESAAGNFHNGYHHHHNQVL